jgi:hypothetical protein
MMHLLVISGSDAGISATLPLVNYRVAQTWNR